MVEKASPHLDRQTIPRLVERPGNGPGNDVAKIYMDRITQHTAESGVGQAGLQKVYQEVGKEIIDYEFRGGEPNLAEVYTRFRNMGLDIGVLVDVTRDRVLYDELFSWFGRLTPDQQDPTKTIFQPSNKLMEMPYMDQLTPDEWLVCYATFQEGLISSLIKSSSPLGIIADTLSKDHPRQS